MPIGMGIMCERCGTVHFIAAASNGRVEFDRPSTTYKLTCACNQVRLFHKTDIRPYSVPVDAYHLGHAGRGEYQELPFERHATFRK